MKHSVRLLAFFVTFACLLCCAACTGDPTPSVSSAPSAVSKPAVTDTRVEETTLSISYDRFWTWADLYDHLESSVQSGNLAFDADRGEYALLFDTDGVTPLSDWKLQLKQDMVAVEYTADGREIRRILIHITHQPKEESKDTSKVSVPSATGSRPAVSSKAPSVPAAESSEPEKPEKTVITVCGSTDKQFKKAVESFNRQSKTVEVKISDATGLFTADRLAQLKDTDTCPQLVLMDHTEMQVAAAEKLLYDLSKFNTRKLAKKLDETCWAATAAGNKRYGLPVGCSTYAIACNDEILYRCDLTLPATFEELLTAAATVRDTLPGVTPLGLVTAPADSKTMSEQFTMMLWSYGGEFLTEDCRSAAFYSVEGTQTVQLYKKLQQDSLLGKEQTYNAFFEGKTAFAVVNSTQYSQTFGKRAKVNGTAIGLLTPGEVPAVSFLEVYSYCIPAKASAKERKAAWEFLEFYLSDPDYSLADCRQRDWIPALNEARGDKYYETEEWQVFISAIPTARTYPVIDCADTVNGYLSEAVAAVLAGEDENAALAKAKEKTDLRLERK